MKTVTSKEFYNKIGPMDAIIGSSGITFPSEGESIVIFRNRPTNAVLGRVIEKENGRHTIYQLA